MRREVFESAAVVWLAMVCLPAAVFGHYYVAGACFTAAFAIAVHVGVRAYRNMCK